MIELFVIILWLSSGFYGAGITWAYWRREYRILPTGNLERCLVVLDVVGGPCSVLSSYMAGTYGYGWKMPFTK